MALLQSNSGKLGSNIIDFTLKCVDGKFYSIESFNDSQILVIVFMCNHCPYVIAVLQRLIDLQNKFKTSGVTFVGINPNDADSYPDDSYEKMVSFAKERKMNFSYLVDDSQKVASEYDAVCTPDIYVYDESRTLKYRGRIDDNWKEEEKVVNKDLEKAIYLLLDNKEINFEQVPSMGCSIKWK